MPEISEKTISLPEEFKSRMKKQLGSEYDEFEKALLEGERFRGLRINPLKGKKAETEEILRAEFPELGELVPWTETGFYYSESADAAPGKHPFHEAGVYYIQEPSAMLPAQLLEAKPGERILDLCAAPGGKSTQIAGFMDGKGLLVSNEINTQRARILSENIERMGIRNAVVTNESPESLANRFEGFFDRIMVDAPCSGEGMFRKNDEAISEWSLENVKLCAERQANILDCAAKMLRSGGRIVYSTCTFAAEEDEESIENFLERNPEFSCISQHRLWPHKVRGEGHFAAVLEKGSFNERKSSDIPMASGDMKKIRGFLGDIVLPDLFEEGGALSTGRLETFGENIFLVPKEMLSLKGLKVLRPGLCLGSLKKDRFEPAHSLAQALNAGNVLRSVSLPVKDAADYIKGLTKNTDGEKGWTLVCVEGFSLGWGKASGGVLKNHYPKGLRKG